MKLSKNFTLKEMIVSNTAKKYGIDNTPSDDVLYNIKNLVEYVLQPIRDKYGKPIVINSGYRCLALNNKVGGSKTSQHLTGAAADIEDKSGNNKELFYLIKKMIENGEIEVGQLIWEYGTKENPNWVHVSLPKKNKKNQILYYYS
ncbi:MAG: peptidase M15 [Bacilli bacterium]|nr:peptidase M15 [Bacilli bacterium]